jgi:hypothetical protein
VFLIVLDIALYMATLSDYVKWYNAITSGDYANADKYWNAFEDASKLE